MTLRNATLACIKQYKWTWNVAEAHVQAVNVMYARQQVSVGRITRTRTENRTLLPLDGDLQELVDSGMPPGDAVFHQEKRNQDKVNKIQERNARRERGSPVTSDEEGGGAGVVGASRGGQGVEGEDSPNRRSPVIPRNMTLEFEKEGGYTSCCCRG